MTEDIDYHEYGRSKHSFTHKLSNEMSRAAYYGLFASMLLSFLALFGVAGYLTSAWTPSWLLMMCLLPAFGGTFMTGTDKPMMTAIGGFLCAGGLGMFMGPLVGHYKVASLVNIAAYTGGITICMVISSAIFRNVVAGLGGALFGALVMLLGGNFVLLFLSIFGINIAPAMSLIDCFAVVIFSLYIAYDMTRLEMEPQTANTAINVAVNIFLDIANLYITLLRLIGVVDDE